MSNELPGPTIPITINGEAREVDKGLSVRSLLELIGLDTGRVAVEVNRRLVRKPDWESTPIHAGAAVEIVTFVGGG